MQGPWVQALVEELRCHMPYGQKNQNIKQEQHCNKSNQDFKKKREIERDLRENNCKLEKNIWFYQFIKIMQILCSKTGKMHKIMKVYLKFNSSYFHHWKMLITLIFC